MVALLVAAVSAMNLVYQVIRKPTELFFPVSSAFSKMPAETWRQYGPLFREFSTDAVTAELLAALAQVESDGNPVARTYWRWRLTWNPFAVFQPASSAVGMYQLTDAAFADARHYCIRRHTVVEEGCRFSGFYSRIVPSHAIELTAVLLDRNVTAVLSGNRDVRGARNSSRILPPSSISVARGLPALSRAAAFVCWPASCAATRWSRSILPMSMR
ncbi:MAG TPA: hypothetical protein VES39_05315 [Rhodospirillales bacterium]|nr:hypothetical protein [Rhodospirillales bacterium]